MAITAVGFNAQQVSEAMWSKIMRALGTGAAPSVVMSGFDASVGAGTRAVAVSAGEAMVAGTYITSTSVVTVNATANATGAARQDWLVLKVTWGASPSGIIEIVAGGTTLPSLTQTAGTSWRMPLAQIQVPAGASAIPAANIIVRKPTPRFTNIFVSTPAAIAAVFASSGGVTVDSINLADPGWSYKVKVNARIRVRNTGTPPSGGAVELSANVDGVQFGQAVSNPLTSGLVENLGVPVQLTDVSPVQTGPCRVDLITAPNNFPTPGSYEVYGNFNKFVVEQIPV